MAHLGVNVANVHAWPTAFVRYSRCVAHAFTEDLAPAGVNHAAETRRVVSVQLERTALLGVFDKQPARHEQSASPKGYLPIWFNVRERQVVEDARNKANVTRTLKI